MVLRPKAADRKLKTARMSETFLLDGVLLKPRDPKKFLIVFVSYHSVAQERENCWVKMLAHIVFIAESNSGEKS
jgi:hypothetical protein